MTKKLNNFTEQEKEIARLRQALADLSIMIADLADKDGLDTNGCVEVLRFIQKSIRGGEK